MGRGMSALCRCGRARRDRHKVTDDCLTPEDQALVRQFIADYDMAELGPWWHQAAGRDLTTPAHAAERAPASPSPQATP